MGRKAKYSEEALLAAVVKYAEVYDGRLAANALAAWASENVPGLEGVQDYHFLRPINEKNQRTGKMESRDRLCKVRMDEINRTRSIAGAVQRNLLLSNSDIGEFLSLPQVQQRKLIQDARIQMQKLTQDVARLTKENELYRTVNQQLQKVHAELADALADIEKEQDIRGRQIAYLMQCSDEETRQKLLREKGFGDGTLELNQYLEYLEERKQHLFSFKNIVSNYPAPSAAPTADVKAPVNETDEISDIISTIFTELE